MKAWLILIVLSFAIGIGVLELIQGDAGYVLISLYGRTLETSFWFATSVIMVALLLVFTVLILVVKVVKVLLSGGAWYKKRRRHGIERHYREGLLNYLTGDFKKASKQLSSVSKRNELPVVRVIASALAVAEEGDVDTALKDLKAAEKKYPEDLVWIYKARIPLHISLGQEVEVEQLLYKLKSLSPNDDAIVRLEHLKLTQRENWQGASNYVADKKVLKQLDGDEVEHTYASALTQLLQSQDADYSEVLALWEKIPKKMRVRDTLLIPYAQLLFKLKKFSLLEELIVFSVEKSWLPELIDLYAKIDSSDKSLQLKKAERWLIKHEDDATLALCLGVLSMKNQLWGKARAYFEKANKIHENSRALYFLGYLAEKLSESESATSYYKRAAELSSSD